MNLSFLKNIQVSAAPLPINSRSIAGKPENNPTNADLRLFKDGKIYPSLALVEKYNLEYRPQNSTDTVGNAFDVFLANTWQQYDSAAPNLILIAAVSRDLPKTDLFSSTKWNADGNPISSVVTQGASTFGLLLIEMLKSTYGVTSLFNEDGYVDLKIEEDYPIKTPDNIYFVPKKITRGNNAGNMSYTRRENLDVYPLTIINTTTDEEVETAIESSSTTVEVLNEF